jgi:chromosome partitioning protein
LEFENDGKPTISELIYEEVSQVRSNNFTSFIRHNEKENIDFIPSNKMLGGIYAILGADGNSNTVFRRIFKNEFFSKYDFILFDCPTAIDNLLVSNALECSNKLLIPVQAELLSFEGVPAILEQFMRIKNISTEEQLKKYIAGMLLTMYDSRTIMGKEIMLALKESYNNMVFNTPIPMLQEAKKSTEERSSLVRKNNSRVGDAYMTIAKEIAEQKLTRTQCPS